MSARRQDILPGMARKNPRGTGPFGTVLESRHRKRARDFNVIVKSHLTTTSMASCCWSVHFVHGRYIPYISFKCFLQLSAVVDLRRQDTLNVRLLCDRSTSCFLVLSLMIRITRRGALTSRENKGLEVASQSSRALCACTVTV
jgi:hypothetical protein